MVAATWGATGWGWEVNYELECPPTISEARFAKRKAAREVAARKGLTIRSFGNVQAGTLAMLNELRKGRRGGTGRNLSMDELLYKLARLGQKYGV